METLLKIQTATRAARARTGDRSIGTCVKAGKFDVVRVTYNKRGTSTVTPVASGLTVDGTIAALNAL
jgi:hypothetical protein